MESLEVGDMAVECRMLPVPAREGGKRDGKWGTFGTLSQTGDKGRHSQLILGLTKRNDSFAEVRRPP